MKTVLFQSKGGAGKSFCSRLLYAYHLNKNQTSHFIDIDNASGSLTKFFNSIEERKNPKIEFANFNLMGANKKIDRSLFDLLLSEISTRENVVIDAGAATSEQILYYLRDEEPNGIIGDLKEMNIRLMLVVAGGGSARECYDFFEEAKNIPGLKDITYVVANEFLGEINGLSVKEYFDADIQIRTLTNDPTSAAELEWSNLMNNGFVMQDIEQLPLFRKRRILNYLKDIFNQIDSL